MPRAHNNDNQARLLAYLAAGIRSSEEIQKRLGLSQPTNDFPTHHRPGRPNRGYRQGAFQALHAAS